MKWEITFHKYYIGWLDLKWDTARFQVAIHIMAGCGLKEIIPWDGYSIPLENLNQALHEQTKMGQFLPHWFYTA